MSISVLTANQRYAEFKQVSELVVHGEFRLDSFNWLICWTDDITKVPHLGQYSAENKGLERQAHFETVNQAKLAFAQAVMSHMEETTPKPKQAGFTIIKG